MKSSSKLIACGCIALSTACWAAMPAAPSDGPRAARDTPTGLADRVRNALHSAPYLYDGHVEVSVENGNVVLNGFVLSEWDLLDTIRIANDAAKPHRVIDNLSIEVGGRR